MLNDSISLSELKAKLEELETERQRLNTAYQVLEEMIRAKEAKAPPAQEAPAAPAPVPPPPPAQRTVWPPVKKREVTVEDRAVHELEKARRFLTTNELVDAMVQSGYNVGKKNPVKVYDSVYGSLDHARKKANARIVRENGSWGLLEWGEKGGPA